MDVGQVLVANNPSNLGQGLSQLQQATGWLISAVNGKIKTNHIFSCTDDGTQIRIWQSNLEEHQEYVLNLWKRGTWDGVTQAQLIEHADKVLKPNHCVGLNP